MTVRPLTVTLDLEDHRPRSDLPVRYPAIMDKILDFFALHNVKATVFTVGTLAQESPALIRRVHEAGHEIAHHSYDHTVLTQQTPNVFRHHTRRSKDILENIIGEKVAGYRAPVFSLTARTIWAVDILKELGFEYSSSVLPAANPLHGMPHAPQTPFRWANGLLEIPAPIGKIGPMTMPYLGGFYMRYIPFPLINRCVRQAPTASLLWTYCHPYDFDAQEKNWRIKGASVPVSLLLWFNRKNTFSKMARILSSTERTLPLKNQDFSNITQQADITTL